MIKLEEKLEKKLLESPKKLELDVCYAGLDSCQICSRRHVCVRRDWLEETKVP